MTELNQVYRCEVCGNIVEVVHASNGQLVCCNQPMKLLEENTVDAALEKHVPVIETPEDKIIVKIGEVPHPMDQDHYIEFIELIADDKTYKKHLQPGDKPEAVFNINPENFTARAYCNLHGLWKK